MSVGLTGTTVALTAADKSKLLRSVVSEAVGPSMKRHCYTRLGRHQLWIHELPELTRVIGFDGNWFGGPRTLRWGVWIPSIAELVYEPPFTSLTGLVSCHVGGELAHLLADDEYRERMEALNGGRFDLEACRADDGFARAKNEIQGTLDVFASNLGRFGTREDVIRFLLATGGPKCYRQRFWPTEGLTEIFVVALMLVKGETVSRPRLEALRTGLGPNSHWAHAVERICAYASG
jgi:hypothetical protein